MSAEQVEVVEINQPEMTADVGCWPGEHVVIEFSEAIKELVMSRDEALAFADAVRHHAQGSCECPTRGRAQGASGVPQ